jgi:hypothetical protein
MTEPTPVAAAPRRGRPRPESTLKRDEQVFALVNGDVTRKQIAAQLADTKESQVYLSLLRLRAAGRVEHVRENGVHVWRRAGATPAAPTA